MNSTGNKKSGYLVALLLVVGLAAFSNSMRELAEIYTFLPQTTQKVVVAKVDSCDSRQAVQSVEEVEWLEDVEGITEPGVQLTVPAPPAKVQRVARRARVKPTEIQLAKVDKFGQFEFHTTPFDMTMFKARNRKNNNLIKLNPRDREMILRTLNRSINLRTAS